MDREPFDKIMSFCHDQDKGAYVRNNAYCIFTEAFLRAYDDFEKSEGKPPSPQKKQVMVSTLITEDAIQGHVAKAEELIASLELNLLSVYKQNSTDSPGFWMSAWTSTVGAFIYSIILLLIYFITLGDIDNLVDIINKGGNKSELIQQKSKPMLEGSLLNKNFTSVKSYEKSLNIIPKSAIVPSLPKKSPELPLDNVSESPNRETH